MGYHCLWSRYSYLFFINQLDPVSFDTDDEITVELKSSDERTEHSTPLE
jgi:hypothetical protein